MSTFEELLAHVAALGVEDKRRLLKVVRESLPAHPMEVRLMASAETLLEAIQRASPLTIRGIEGILAEASFAIDVVPGLHGWKSLEPPSNSAYDFALLEPGAKEAFRLQVKMQRRKDGKPLTADQVAKKRKWLAIHWVVEVQRTRAGEDKTGESTRPYRYGEFDILAVSLGASTGKWSNFVYTPSSWLLPDLDDPRVILKYQPVSQGHSEDWTNDLNVALARFRSGTKHTIAG